MLFLLFFLLLFIFFIFIFLRDTLVAFRCYCFCCWFFCCWFFSRQTLVVFPSISFFLSFFLLSFFLSFFFFSSWGQKACRDAFAPDNIIFVGKFLAPFCSSCPLPSPSSSFSSYNYHLLPNSFFLSITDISIVFTTPNPRATRIMTKNIIVN